MKPETEKLHARDSSFEHSLPSALLFMLYIAASDVKDFFLTSRNKENGKKVSPINFYEFWVLNVNSKRK